MNSFISIPSQEKAVFINEPPHTGHSTFKWLCRKGGHAIKKAAQRLLACVNECVCQFIKEKHVGGKWNDMLLK